MDIQSGSGPSRVSVTCPDTTGRLVRDRARSAIAASRSIGAFGSGAGLANVADCGRSAKPEFSPEVSLWLALRRVRRGNVRWHPPDLVTDGGRRLPGYLGLAMRELFDNGQIRLGEGHEDGQPVVEITPSGEELFVELEQEYRVSSSKKDRSTNGDTTRTNGERQ